MKRIYAILLSLISISVFAGQNIQLHYDFRRLTNPNDVATMNGQIATATYEFTHIDRLGTTFMFVDLDFSSLKGIDLAYMEISRSFKIGSFPVEPFIEFDGGVATFGRIPAAYLAGVQYPKMVGNFFLNPMIAYKVNAFDRVSHDAQFTLVWNGSFCSDRLTFSGFMDIWSQNKGFVSGQGKDVVFLSEPQLWYNVIPGSFSIGTEVELSYSFLSNKQFYCLPTLGVKYSF